MKYTIDNHKHTYIINITDDYGGHCKFCLLLKSTIESPKKTKQQPLGANIEKEIRGRSLRVCQKHYDLRRQRNIIYADEIVSRTSCAICKPEPLGVEGWEKDFDKLFVRDDGLMDKYMYGDKGEILTTAEAIKYFFVPILNKQKQSTLREVEVKVIGKDDAWGGYDGEAIVDDENALIRNDLRAKQRKALEALRGKEEK